MGDSSDSRKTLSETKKAQLKRIDHYKELLRKNMQHNATLSLLKKRVESGEKVSKQDFEIAKGEMEDRDLTCKAIGLLLKIDRMEAELKNLF